MQPPNKKNRSRFDFLRNLGRGTGFVIRDWFQPENNYARLGVERHKIIWGESGKTSYPPLYVETKTGNMLGFYENFSLGKSIDENIGDMIARAQMAQLPQIGSITGNIIIVGAESSIESGMKLYRQGHKNMQSAYETFRQQETESHARNGVGRHRVRPLMP